MPENKIPDMSRDAMNAFPFWFDKIKDIETDLKIPRSVCIEIPADIRRAFYMESQGDAEKIGKFVENIVHPASQDAKLGLVFLKNGCYSHKFDARSACLPVMSDLTHAVLTIMNEAMLRCGFQYDGTEVLVARERIKYDPKSTPCIYNGLPFRPEYRVFYDFDKKAPVFTVDYWDKNYVYKNLHELTDKIIYDAWYGYIKQRYDANWKAVQYLMSKAMEQVQGLSGCWSVDVLQDEDDNLWLIDMAVAEMSAYWEKRPDGYK